MAELDADQTAGSPGEGPPDTEQQDPKNFRRSPVSAFLAFSRAERTQRDQHRDDFDPDLFNEAVDLAWKKLRAHGAEG